MKNIDCVVLDNVHSWYACYDVWNLFTFGAACFAFGSMVTTCFFVIIALYIFRR